LSGEVLDSVDGGIGFKNHDISYTGHVFLLETLNVESAVISRDGLRNGLVVHFYSENLTITRCGGGVSGLEDNIRTRLDGSLFDTSSEHITNTLNFVDSRDGSSGNGGDSSLGNSYVFLETIKEGVDVDRYFSLFNVGSLPPVHVSGLGDQVISLPAGDGEERNGIGDEVLQPTDSKQHTFHFFFDFSVSGFFVSSKIGIHLVDTNK